MIAIPSVNRFAIILVLAWSPAMGAQDSDAVKQVNELLSRDPVAAISTARELLEDEGLTDVERARLLHLWARGLTMTGDFSGALSKLDEARRLAEVVDNQRLVTRILQAEAVASCEAGDFKRGAEAARAGIRLAKENGDKLLFGVLHSELGTNLYGQSDYEGAIAALSTALDVARNLRKPKLHAMVVGNLASIQDELGNFARATELQREALKFFEEADNQILIASTKVNLANSLLNQHMIDEAEPLFQETIELAKKLNLLNLLAMAHAGCGDVALYRSDVAQAEIEYRLAREIWEQLGDQSGLLMIVERSARIEGLKSHDIAADPQTVEELEAAFPAALEAGNKKQAIAIAGPLVAEYESREQWQQALQLTKLVAELEQQIWSDENRVLMADAESQLELLEKEKQIETLNHTNQVQDLELRNQRIVRLLFTVALVLSFIVIGVVWRSLIVRRRAYQNLEHAHAERRRQEQRHIELERKLADQNKTESLRIMAGGVAHDFNNLMTGVVGQAEVGRLKAETHEKNEHFEHIVDAARQASGLTSQLISFAGSSVNRTNCLDLGQVLTSTTGLLQSIAKPTAEITSQASNDPLPVVGDETQIRQVLVNLVKNAAESIEHHGKIRITAGRKTLSTSDLTTMPLGGENAQGEHCFLSVQDDGCGMDPDLQNKIFDPFFSTKFVGRGLGLASVMGIVRSHRGAIRVESEVDVGTIFTVYLPLSSQRQIDSASGHATRAVDVPGSQARQIGVMFVDDDPLVRQSTTKLLAAYGFQVFSAESAEAAVDVAEQHRGEIHVAVIDYAMTGHNGIWLAERLNEKAPEIKRILCSGYTEDTIRKTDLFEAFLPKPYVAVDLVELLERTVGPFTAAASESLETRG